MLMLSEVWLSYYMYNNKAQPMNINYQIIQINDLWGEILYPSLQQITFHTESHYHVGASVKLLVTNANFSQN